jgi:hypothetical protein
LILNNVFNIVNYGTVLLLIFIFVACTVPLPLLHFYLLICNFPIVFFLPVAATP